MAALPSLKSINLYTVAAVGFIAVLFLVSPLGRDFQTFLFGNTCPTGNIYDAALKVCVPAQSKLACGAGTYLKYSQDKGYSCEMSNFAYALIAVIAALALYFYFMQKRGEQWREAAACFKKAVNTKQLKTYHPNWLAAWDHVEEVHQILPRSAWLYVGEFVKPGEHYSALITGTDDRGWVLDGWKAKIEERQINILKKQSMKLDQALITVAAEKMRIDKASEIFKTEQAEMEGMQ